MQPDTKKWIDWDYEAVKYRERVNRIVRWWSAKFAVVYIHFYGERSMIFHINHYQYALPSTHWIHQIDSKMNRRFLRTKLVCAYVCVVCMLNDGSSSKLLYTILLSVSIFFFSLINSNHTRLFYAISLFGLFILFISTHYVRVCQFRSSTTTATHMSATSIQQFTCVYAKEQKEEERQHTEKTNFQLSSHQSRTTFSQLTVHFRFPYFFFWLVFAINIHHLYKH